MAKLRKLAHLLVVSALLTALIALAAPALASAKAKPEGGRNRDSNTQFYVPKPNQDALRQIAQLTSQGRKAEADQIRAMINTPTAVWVESGSPKAAEQQVRQITHQAAGKKTIPVFVLYNIPFRDCAQYSAGGASTVAEYEAWIDGVVAGLGDSPAFVIVEPDSLGLIPGVDCSPEGVTATAEADRYAMLNYAVDKLNSDPNARIYLDATHSGWMNVGNISQRLVRAGVLRADGFFLNVSNYQYTTNQVYYGTWISECIAYATQVSPDNFAGCPNQYWNGGPATGWEGRALDNSRIWVNGGSDLSINVAGIESRYASLLGSVQPTAHFVIDTSRNGQGPWTPTPEQQAAFPDPQTWCNPPQRGIGLRPTTNTGNPLVDAYLWIKVPGESDGQCSRGLGTGNNVVDPIWGQVDPAAGVWFPKQALDLARLANPPLK